MSDMTALSHQYAANRAFAEQVSAWLLTLKKAFADVPATTPRPNEEELRRARAQLAAVLNRLLERFAAEDQVPGGPEEELPEEVYHRIEASHLGEVEWLAQDLRAVVAALEAGSPPDTRGWQLLDEVGDAADASASAAFRRLWRR
ncbi:MAG: hypothetical protein L0Z62_26230 [Gemmataceae bacterium]|nr:hypothetical protein [Gemmataceae bacterium]